VAEHRQMQQFSTGATRDSSNDKIDYEGFLSPIALEAFGDYMNVHRKQADGKMRESDNWQKGIPLNNYMKSLFRHFTDAWALHRGLQRFDRVDGHEINIVEALCAVLFNTQGYLHEYIKAKSSVVLEPISVDLDGVLGNFTDLVRPIIEEVIGHEVHPSLYPPTSWNWEAIVCPDQMPKVWEKIKGTYNFWTKEKPFYENVFALKMFLELYPKQEVFFITSRVETKGASVKTQSEHWLMRQGLWPRNGLSRVIVLPSDKKIDAINAHKIRFSIDDKPETVEQCNAKGGQHLAYLLNREWNMNYPNLLPRVTSMADFLHNVLTYQQIDIGESNETLTEEI
jgi:hypothetical protein